MILSGWKGANERQTTITSWFIGISAILLVLYLTAPKPNADKEWFDYYFEAFAVILLIVSILLYMLSATYLLQPFYQDNEPTKEQLKQSADLHKTSTNSRSFHDILGYWIFDPP